MKQFHCDFTPNWHDFFNSKGWSAAETDKGIKLTRFVRFSVTVDSEGKLKLSHSSPKSGVANVANAAEVLKTAIDNVQDMADSLLEEWAEYGVSVTFPEPGGKFQLKEQPNGWRLVMQSDQGELTWWFDEDSTIRRLDAVTPEMISIVHPYFTSTKDGLLAYSVEIELRSKSSTSANSDQRYDFTYQTVDGLQLPRKITLTTNLKGRVARSEIILSNCGAIVDAHKRLPQSEPAPSPHATRPLEADKSASLPQATKSAGFCPDSAAARTGFVLVQPDGSRERVEPSTDDVVMSSHITADGTTSVSPKAYKGFFLLGRTYDFDYKDVPLFEVGYHKLFHEKLEWGAVEVDLRVEGTEAIKIGGCTYDTYVVKEEDRKSDGTKYISARKYYSPALRQVVKTDGALLVSGTTWIPFQISYVRLEPLN